MLTNLRVRTLAAAGALLLSATTACAEGEREDEAASTPSPSAELPASLASAEGWLAYSTFIGEQDRLHVVKIDGSQDHQVAPELPGEVIRGSFSPNGELAFEHRPPDDAYNVYVADADGTGARIVARCEPNQCERGSPAWSPDGKHLATETSLGPPAADGPPPEFALSIIDVATQQVRTILRHPSHESQDQIPRWSPDGRKLVFYRWRAAEGQAGESSDAEAAVFTVNVDGTGLRQITPWEMRCGDPDWSPDGSTILCTTNPPYDFDTAEGDIYAMNPDGSDLRALTTNDESGARAGHARFTPDGEAILYVRAATQDWRSPPRHIHALEIRTGKDVPVLTKRDIYTRPALQPPP